MKFTFIFKDAKRRSTLFFCLRDGRERARISTGIIAEPGNFDKEKMMFTSGIGMFDYNEIVEKWKYKAAQEIRTIQVDPHSFNDIKEIAERIRMKVNGNSEMMRSAPVSLNKFYEDWATGKIKSKHPRRTDKCSYKVFAEFVKNRTVKFETVNYRFLDKFQNWLRIEKGYKINTIGAHIKDLKAVMNLAYKLGLHNSEAFRQFTKPSEEVDNIYLKREEVDAIIELEGLSSMEEKARDLFIVGCYTAMRLSDYSKLTVADVEGRFIRKRQKKTKGEVIIPVHPKVREIIKKYRGAPKLSDAVFNRTIKIVCQKAGINEKIYKEGQYHEKWQLVSSHTARRTGATLLYLQGVPTLSIMMITGHKSESSFRKYIKITLEENAEALAKIDFFNK